VSSDTFHKSDSDTCDIQTSARTVADNVDKLDTSVSISVSNSTMSAVTSVTAMSTIETVGTSQSLTATSSLSATSTVESVSTSQNVTAATSPSTVTVNTLSHVCEASTVPSHEAMDVHRFTESYPVEVICPLVLYLTEAVVGSSFSLHICLRQCLCLRCQQQMARCIILSAYLSGRPFVVRLSVCPHLLRMMQYLCT